LIDDQATPDGELYDMLLECELVASGCALAAPKSELARMLEEVVEDARTYASFPAFWPLWSASLTRVTDGMMYARWASRRIGRGESAGCLPSLEEYLYYARSSIGLFHLWVGGAFVEPDPNLLSLLAALSPVADRCAIAMRLANDIASFERESAQGEINAITIVAAAPGSGPIPAGGDQAITVARQAVEDRMNRELAAAHRLIEARGAEAACDYVRAERLVRATEYGIAMYLARDFRLWDEHSQTNSGNGP
jgi:hypothetical protein